MIVFRFETARIVAEQLEAMIRGRVPDMRVECEVHVEMLTNDEDREIEGVVVECGRRGHEEESFGTHGASVRRCLVLLRENCPKGEKNYYVDEDADD